MLMETWEEALAARGSAQNGLHAQAAETRDAARGPLVFLRGVLEISNFCRENCSYCGMRRDNRALARRRLSAEELFEILVETCPPEITDINLQAGEDPIAVREVALPLLEMLERYGRWGLSVGLGTLAPHDYAALRQAGAGYYIIKMETGDAEHYRALGAPGTLEERVTAIRHLSETGWYVSSGFIYGLPGQTPASLRRTWELLRSLPLAGSSVSPFIPGEGTPLAQAPAASIEDTLNCIALLRLAFPSHFIPAVSALETQEPGAYARALRAGANLATINLTPPSFQPNYLLYSRRRVIMSSRRVLEAVEEAEMEPSPRGILETLRGAALCRA